MNDYFTFFYVKHFELPMCMKCAIQINLPCLDSLREKAVPQSASAGSDAAETSS